MGETSAIEWADATWNPVIGCAKVSPACATCYAEAHWKRMGRPELWRGERHITSASTWGLPERLDRKAAKAGRRLRLFVASNADVFEDHPVWIGEPPAHADDGRSVSLRWAALRKLAKLRHVDVLLLTKRPQNILRMVPPEWTDDGRCDFRAKPELWPTHVWVGTTVEDQQRADERLPHLLRVPARVRFVSYEPALGPVDFRPWLGDEVIEDKAGRYVPQDGRGLHWVIAGGESGPRARPAHPDWFRSVRDECAAAGVPFLFKQWGEWVPGAFQHHECDLSSDSWMNRPGKKAAGRLLDGVVHDGFPR